MSQPRSQKSRHSRPAIAFAVLLLVAVAGCRQGGDTRDTHFRGTIPEPVAGTQQRDILLISVDTLRADHMSIYGYPRETTPNLERLFENAAIFMRAHATESNTPASVTSILSGLQPREHRMRLFYQLLDNQVPLVSDYLANTHTTAAFVSNMVLTDEAMGMASRFDHFDDFVNTKESERTVFERNAGDTTDALLSWLEAEQTPRNGPVFVWAHYIDPHGPYQPPSGWTQRFEHDEPHEIDPNRVPDYQRVEGRTDGLHYVDDYDEEIAYTDSQVARLIEGFDARRGLDDTLVILTADHGETMMEGEEWFTHGYNVYQSLINVPLIVMGPGVAKGERPHLVSTIDVLPTVLEFSGFKPVTTLGGYSLMQERADANARIVFAEATERGAQWRAALRGDRKWAVNLRADNGEIVILEKRAYDLSKDPHELAPSDWSKLNETQKALLAEIELDPDPAGIPERYDKGNRLSEPKLARDPGDGALEHLRALGYVD